MTNKYLEKIAHWARYVGPGGAKRFESSISRISKATSKNIDIGRIKGGDDLDEALSKSLNKVFTRQGRINAMGVKITNDRKIAKNVNIGITAGAASAGAGLYAKNKFYKKED